LSGEIREEREERIVASAEAARRIISGLTEAGIDMVAAVPDENLLEVFKALAADDVLDYTPVGREEEGIGVCTGGYLTGHQAAMLMQNGGLLNSCNGLTTTALQFQIPMLLLVYYAGDLGDRAFHMLGLVTEPVLQALGIKHQTLRDPSTVVEQIGAAATSARASKRPVALLLTRAVL
jgi:sulfopyruvate decarboxylase alpha subunit